MKDLLKINFFINNYMEKIDLNKIFIGNLKKYRGTSVETLFDNVINKRIIKYDKNLFIVLSILSYLINNRYNLNEFHKNLYSSLKFVLSLKDSKINLKLEVIKKGGKSSNIYPTIHEVFKNNEGVINIYSDTNQSVKYKIKNPVKFSFYPPLFGSGSFTAVYLVNKEDSTDTNDYILRLTEIEDTTHFYDTKKTENEYLNFPKYLCPVYNYGILSFKFNLKQYKYYYVITKKYVDSDNFKLTNKQKFDFLLNIVKMLDELYEKNYFHGDFKIENISYDENLTPIFIDYDNETLLEANDKNPLIKYNTRCFVSTYLPEYYKNITTPEEYNMYSIGGLKQIIEKLNIPFNKESIELPTELIFNNKKILYLSTYSLYDYFGLTSKFYHEIIKYNHMYNILIYIKSQNLINEL